MTPMQQNTIEWLANGDTGTSSETMAFWLAFGIKRRWPSRPSDPADFDRCLRLLDAVPEMRPHLHKMSEMSNDWKKLVEKWDEIERLHLNEVVLGWTKGSSAPKTYRMMKVVLDELY